jgi:hypothetical protein
MEWNNLRKEIEGIYRKKSHMLGIKPDMDLQSIENALIEGGLTTFT